MDEKPRKPTIQDVAKRAGVSLGTASNVLNRTRPVSEKKRILVTQAAKDLGFQLNSAAQNMRRKKTWVIGLCTTYTTTAFLSAFADAFEDAAAERGYDVMMAVTRQDPDRELRRIKALVFGRVDGLLLLPTRDPTQSLEFIAEAGTPTVVVDRPCADLRFDYVTINQHDVMAQIVNHLLKCGHRRILFVPQRSYLLVSKQRAEGIEQAIVASGMSARCRVLERGEDRVTYAANLRARLSGSEPPTAIIAGNSSVAMWTLEFLSTAKDIKDRSLPLVTLDDPDWGLVTTPRISTVRYPVEAIVETAWAILERRMSGDNEKPRHTVIPAEFVPRDIGPPHPDIQSESGN